MVHFEVRRNGVLVNHASAKTPRDFRMGVAQVRYAGILYTLQDDGPFFIEVA